MGMTGVTVVSVYRESCCFQEDRRECREHLPATQREARQEDGVAAAMIATYDDGRSDVPGGVTGPVERVVVVGAGIAGLTVANALANAGVALCGGGST